MEARVVQGSRRRGHAVALVVVLTLVACGAVACGSVGYTPPTGDRSAGKDLFIKGCGSCHTLQDAGTTGQIGPNLDYAFVEDRRNGIGESTIRQVVRDQIAYPTVDPVTGSPGMPANIYTGQEADDVASYVSSVAGIGVSGSGGQTTTPPPATTPAPGGATTGNQAASVAAGKQVFATAGCTGCHTLADAGSNGTVGPNLDNAKPSAALVTQRVTNGKTDMPPFKGQLTPQQIKDVADYVSSVAGK